MFLRRILEVPTCVPYAALYLETDQNMAATQAWLRANKYWLRIHYNFKEGSFAHQILQEQVRAQELDYIEKNISLIGPSLESLGSLPQKEAFHIIKRKLLDIEFKDLLSAANKTYSPLNHLIPVRQSHRAIYLHLLQSPQKCRAYSLARFN
ncbi:hypothetical protein JRQ81_016545, partial [Phrynocephalus forsythii]